MTSNQAPQAVQPVGKTLSNCCLSDQLFGNRRLDPNLVHICLLPHRSSGLSSIGSEGFFESSLHYQWNPGQGLSIAHCGLLLTLLPAASVPDHQGPSLLQVLESEQLLTSEWVRAGGLRWPVLVQSNSSPAMSLQDLNLIPDLLDLEPLVALVGADREVSNSYHLERFLTFPDSGILKQLSMTGTYVVKSSAPGLLMTCSQCGLAAQDPSCRAASLAVVRALTTPWLRQLLATVSGMHRMDAASGKLPISSGWDRRPVRHPSGVCLASPCFCMY